MFGIREVRVVVGVEGHGEESGKCRVISEQEERAVADMEISDDWAL
jgi:hypothetical protein